jgi:F-type H+-transporting ATPase subunit gamma
MATAKEIKQRINSIKTTMQITSAMKLVSAAKLRKAQNAILQIRPYAGKLQEVLQNVSAGLTNPEENPYSVQREIQKVLIITISSNKGLCGAFNNNVAKKTIELITNEYKDYQVDIISIGRKVADILKHKGFASLIKEDYNQLLAKKSISYDDVAEIAQIIMDYYAQGKYDLVEIVYNKFKNAAVQILTKEQFLPIKIEKEETNTDYIFEPDKAYIVNHIIPKALKIQFHKCVLDSLASEHGARMTAMHKATDNAKELIKDYTLQYNKARQASITNQILEISSGAEALKNKN